MKAAHLVFTRLPEAGTTKTRLIPALGPAGAAGLRRQGILLGHRFGLPPERLAKWR